MLRGVDEQASDRVVIRRELHAGDLEAMVGLHERLYTIEYALDQRFGADLRRSIETVVANGWPDASGGVWLVDGEGGLLGSLALTHEGPDRGRVRWFLLGPELRGRGLGRLLLAEMLEQARAAGLRRLELDTFSALTAAAHLYRDAGFRVCSQRETRQWGPPIVLQRYELQLP